jgi:hypothetical protein
VSRPAWARLGRCARWALPSALALPLLLALGCSRTSSTAQPAVRGAKRQVVFSGMCDASGAVPLSAALFAVADDEGNVLRIYDADRGGAPLASIDVSEGLNLPEPKAKPKKKKGGKKKRAPETDLEAATRVGDYALWLTSHARAPSGKLKPERHRLFATVLPGADEADDAPELSVVGVPYERLFADLAADPRYAAFGLDAAAQRAPKEPGGVNIEGMTGRPEGGVLIGFRNPVPGGKALLVPFSNPLEVVRGESPRFGDPIVLDLGGLGVRSLSYWHGRYVIAAGHYDTGAPSRLFTWDGQRAPVAVRALDFSRFNPEAFHTPEEREEILVLSDDGAEPVDGRDCKKLRDGGQKHFRGVWVSLPRVSS